MLFNKNIPKDEIRRLSREGSQLLYLTGVPLPAPETSVEPVIMASDQVATYGAGASTPAPKGSYEKSEVSSSCDATGVTEEIARGFTHWLSSRELLMPQSLLLKSMGITGGAKQAKFKRDALSLGLIIEHTLQMHKGRTVFWEPTEKAWLVAGITEPVRKSKGGFLHQELAALIATTARKKGYNVEIESFQSNGKAIDVVLRRDQELIWIELGMSDAQNERSDILRDLASGITPTKLIMACRDGKMKARLQELIAGEPSIVPFRDRIEVVLAGNLISFEQV